MRRMIMPLRYVSSLAAPYALTRRHIAEYLHLGRPPLPYRVQISPFGGVPQRYPLPAESCGTRRGCSRRGHGDAAVPVDDR